MNSQYLTRTELIRRWNRELVDSYFPQCSKVLPNPRNKRYPNMQLYDINTVRRIEVTPYFAEKLLKSIVNERAKRQIARKCPQYIVNNGITKEVFAKLQGTTEETLKVVENIYSKKMVTST